MSKLMLNFTELEELNQMIKNAESKFDNTTYAFDPGFATYSCSCTAHKKSCGWD